MYTVLASDKQVALQIKTASSFEELDWRPLNPRDRDSFARDQSATFHVRTWEASDDPAGPSGPQRASLYDMAVLTVVFRSGARKVLEMATGVGNPMKRAFDFAEEALAAVPELGGNAE